MKVLDLFSGIGGFALATEMAGGSTIALCEIEPFPRRVLAARFPDTTIHHDVRKLCRRIYDCERIDEDGTDAWCPRCNDEFGSCECIGTDQFTDTHGFPDVIVGGVPCQPASLIGERLGADDARWLWPDTIRIVGELRPSYGIFENPAALLTLDGGRAFSGILGSLAALGYDAIWEVLPASALGAGHRRERVWILIADADRPRLEGHSWDGAAGDEQGRLGARPQRSVAAPDLRARKVASPLWYHQSGIQPVADGIPGRLARDQLTAVGNALVPQVAAVWLRAIADELKAIPAGEPRACASKEDLVRRGSLPEREQITT